MIRQPDLATLRVDRIIFHDVPQNPRHGTAQPILTDTETATDARRVQILKKRLVQVFGGTASFDVEFRPESDSPVPESVRSLTSQVPQSQAFIDASRTMAQYLFQRQTGVTSPGLLCVLAVSSRARTGISIMKLEREEGADLHLRTTGQHSAFEMSVLDNLVLTDGTRLFKSALFLREGSNIDCRACDSQGDTSGRGDMARFWLAFLGCRFIEDPAISTQKWFDVSVDFVNQCVDDPVAKQGLYEHIVSELNSNRQMVSPRRFISDYVKRELRQPYENYLREHNAPLQRFSKDTADIQPKLRRLSYHTAEGLAVVVPADKEDLVEVGRSQILVRDTLRTISRK